MEAGGSIKTEVARFDGGVGEDIYRRERAIVGVEPLSLLAFASTFLRPVEWEWDGKRSAFNALLLRLCRETRLAQTLPVSALRRQSLAVGRDDAELRDEKTTVLLIVAKI